MKAFIALLVASWLIGSTPAHAEDDICGYRTLKTGTIFSLDIYRSFDPHVTFKVCAREDPAKNFLLVAVEPKKKPKRRTVRQLPLSAATYAHVVALYEEALSYNVKDSTLGLDGSSWCLETSRGFTYSKACFWSPMDNAKERGISGLSSLGQELWRIAEMDLSVGDLY